MRTLLLSLSFLALAACQPPPEPPVPGAITSTGQVIGTANGSPITQEMVDTVAERFQPGQLDQLKEQGRYQQFLDQMALGQVLYEQAIAEGVDKDPSVQLTLAMASRDALAAEMIQRVGKAAITDEAITKAYEDHAVQFGRPTVHARHLVVAELSKAEELKKQLDGGANFGELVAQHSIDPSTKAEGGDLGWFERERMFPAIAEAAFAADKGQIVGPVETRMGFHLILVEDKRDKTPIDEVRDQLEQMVEQEAIEAYITKLQTEAEISWTDGEVVPPAGSAPAHDGHDHAPGEGH